MRGLTLAVLLLASWVAAAQEFPSKPVRIVVPWPPSGNVDITARTLAPAFGEALGQQIIVENKAGAGGRIGTEAVAKAAPDGYALLLGSSGTISMGVEVMDMNQSEFAAYVRADYEKWRRVAREGNIVVE